MLSLPPSPRIRSRPGPPTSTLGWSLPVMRLSGGNRSSASVQASSTIGPLGTGVAPPGSTGPRSGPRPGPGGTGTCVALAAPVPTRAVADAAASAMRMSLLGYMGLPLPGEVVRVVTGHDPQPRGKVGRLSQRGSDWEESRVTTISSSRMDRARRPSRALVGPASSPACAGRRRRRRRPCDAGVGLAVRDPQPARRTVALVREADAAGVDGERAPRRGVMSCPSCLVAADDQRGPEVQASILHLSHGAGRAAASTCCSSSRRGLAWQKRTPSSSTRPPQVSPECARADRVAELRPPCRRGRHRGEVVRAARRRADRRRHLALAVAAHPVHAARRARRAASSVGGRERAGHGVAADDHRVGARGARVGEHGVRARRGCRGCRTAPGSARRGSSTATRRVAVSRRRRGSAGG